MKNRVFLLSLLFLSATIIGCDSSSSPGTSLQVPATYESENFDANTVAERALLDNLKNLSEIMQEGRVQGVVVEFPRLTEAYTPLSLEATDYYGKLGLAYLLKLSQGSGSTMDPLQAPDKNGDGGVYTEHLYDEHGVEMEQLVEKGLFAAALYHRAVKVMSLSQLPPEDVDKVVALFGARPVFRNSDQAAQDADVFSAKYAARRDKNNGTGFYTKFREAAKLARAASKAGSVHLPALRGALTEMRLEWELSQAATVINYLYTVIEDLSQTDVDDDARSNAMHSYSEAVGFLHGWKGLPVGTTVIKTQEVDHVLELMLAPTDEPWTCYVLWQDPASNLQRLVAAIETIQVVYGFSDRELEDFKQNWVEVQGR